MNDLSPEARALFRSARHAGQPPEGARERVRAGVELKIALGAVGATSATWWSASAAAKALGLAAVVAAASWASSRPPQTAPRVVAPVASSPVTSARVAPRTSATAAAPIAQHEAQPAARALPTRRPLNADRRAPTVAPEPVEEAPPTTAHIETTIAPTFAAPTPAVTVAPTPPVDSLAAEVRCLRSAREALQSNDARGALATLDAYGSRFHSGALQGDAAMLRVRALCADGQVEHARDFVTRWLSEHPGSPLAANLQRSCASEPR